MPRNANRLLQLGHRLTTVWILALVCFGTDGLAQSYRTQVVVSGSVVPLELRPTEVELSFSRSCLLPECRACKADATP